MTTNERRGNNLAAGSRIISRAWQLLATRCDKLYSENRSRTALKGIAVSRPNFLFIIADDHRYSALGSLGMEAVRTPVLDQLRADGTAFTQAHIMGSTSGAVCLPSRGMLMTGRNLFATPDPLPADAPLLPELLWQHGYTTFATGKWHNRRDSFARAFSAGGSIFFGGMSDQYAVPLHDFDPDGAYDPASATIADGYSTTIFADEMIRFLDARQPDDDPFFAYIALTSPHDPRTPPPPYDAMYDPREIILPPSFMPAHPFDIGVCDIRDEKLAEHPRTEDETRRHIADYYGMISQMDAEIGRILATLDARGMRENTIVIYTSDHGLAVGQHGLMGKQNLYDHSMRVPLILRGPGISAAHRSNALVYLLDLFPTLLDRAGVDAPADQVGYSLAPLLDGLTYKHRRCIFSAYQGAFGHPRRLPYQRSIKDERFKLIQSAISGKITWQRCDLREDPHELVNLFGKAEYKGATKRMLRMLRERQTRVQDPLMGFR